MSTASDFAEGLARTEWAKRFVDSCVIERISSSFSAGTYTDTPTTIYSGACLVRPASSQPAEFGDGQIFVRGFLVVVPWDTDGIKVGDQVTVTSTRDGSLNGRVLKVRNVAVDTYNTARKLDCEEGQDA